MKISVITATFNSEATIVRNLESVRTQRYHDFEQIVIDKASTDSTVLKVRNNSDSRVKLISENDNGIYDAFNKGIRDSIGDIVAFLNSDDYYMGNDVFETVRQTFEDEPEAAIVHGKIEVGNAQCKPVQGLFSFGGARVFHPATFVRREVFERIGFFDTSFAISSDLDFFIRARNNNYKFHYIDKVLTHFSLGGISTRNPFIVPFEIKKILLKNNYPLSEANIVLVFELLRNFKSFLYRKVLRRK